MSNNRTFFKNVKEGQMSLGDIFEDVFEKHTPEQTAKVLTPVSIPIVVLGSTIVQGFSLREVSTRMEA